MTFVEAGNLAIAVGVIACLIVAAVQDVRARQIPNPVILVLLGLFIVWTAATHASFLVSGLEAFAITAAGTILLYALKVVGAGDCKLLAVLALFSGLTLLGQLLIVTALAGGVIGGVSLVSRPTRALVLLQMRERFVGGGVPYGVAIAAGGMSIVWSLWLAPIVGPLPSSIQP